MPNLAKPSASLMHFERLLLYRKIILIGIGICMITLFFVPSYAYWIPEAYEPGEVEGWNGETVFEDELFRLLLMPFYTLFPLSLIIKQKGIKTIIKTLLFLSCFLVFLVATACGTVGPDNSGDIGLIFILGIIVLTGIMFVLDWFIANSKNPKA